MCYELVLVKNILPIFGEYDMNCCITESGVIPSLYTHTMMELFYMSLALPKYPRIPNATVGLFTLPFIYIQKK